MHRVAASETRDGAPATTGASREPLANAASSGPAPRIAAAFRSLAPLWDAGEVAALLARRHAAFANGKLALVSVRRGALRLAGNHVDATYELAVAGAEEGDARGGEHRRFALVRALLSAAAALDSAQVLISPEDPRLDTSRLSAAESLRALVAGAIDGAAGELGAHTGPAIEEASALSRGWLARAELVRSEILAHRFGSRFARRVTFAAGGAELDLFVKMRRASSVPRLVLGPAEPALARVPERFAERAIDGIAIDASEWVGGASLHDRLMDAAALRSADAFGGDPSILSLSGAALADFHARARLGPSASSAHAGGVRREPERRSLASELVHLGDLAAAATRLFDGASEPFHAALAQLFRDAAAFARIDRVSSASDHEANASGERRISPLHGDLHDKQILVADGRAVFIDIDSTALGEPELDLGNLVAHLALRALQAGRPLEHARLARARVLSAYAAHSEHGRAPRPDLIALYERATLLRLALLYLLRLNSIHLFGPLLELAERLHTER